MLVVIVSGFTFELLGRRVTLFALLLTLGLTVSQMPTTSPSLPAFYIVASLSVTLFNCLLFTPLMADFVEADSMGKAMALQVMGMNTGMVLSQLVFIYLYNAGDLSAAVAWGMIGALVGVVAIVSIFMVREPSELCFGDGQYQYFFEKEGSLCLHIRILIRKFKKAFKQHMPSYLTLLFLALCIDGPASTQSEYLTPWHRELLKDQYTNEEAEKADIKYYIKIQNTSGGLLSLAFIYFFGILVDLKRPTVVLPITLLAEGVSMMLFFAIRDPDTTVFYVIAPISDLTKYCLVVAVYAYIFKIFPYELRGVLAAVFGATTSLGQLLTTTVRQGLADNFGPFLPFIGQTLLDIILAILILILGSVGVFRSIERRYPAGRRAAARSRRSQERQRRMKEWADDRKSNSSAESLTFGGLPRIAEVQSVDERSSFAVGPRRPVQPKKITAAGGSRQAVAALAIRQYTDRRQSQSTARHSK